MKYEYLVVEANSITGYRNPNNIAVFLDLKDQEGWEFITSDGGVLFFRRTL